MTGLNERPPNPAGFAVLNVPAIPAATLDSNTTISSSELESSSRTLPRDARRGSRMRRFRKSLNLYYSFWGLLRQQPFC